MPDWTTSTSRRCSAGFVQAPTCWASWRSTRSASTGVPVINVNNACASGSTGLYLARQAVGSGAPTAPRPVGFEQMAPGSRGAWTPAVRPPSGQAPGVLAQMGFLQRRTGDIGDVRPRRRRAHAEVRFPTPDHFAWIGWKNHHHSVNNPYAQFQKDFTLDEVKSSPAVAPPLTKLQCSPLRRLGRQHPGQ